MRRLGGLLLIALGVGLALVASHARTFPTRLPAVVAEAPVPVEMEVGNDEPFAPFTVVLVGPLNGDHATLERVFEVLDERGDVDLTFVFGVTGGYGQPVAPMAEVVAAHGDDVVFLPADGETPPWEEHDRVRSVLTFPEEARLRHNECRLVASASLSQSIPDLGGTQRSREPLPSGPFLILRVAATAPDGALGAASGTRLAPSLHADHVDIKIVAVRSRELVEESSVRVPRGSTLRSLWRDFELRFVGSIVQRTTGFVLLLIAATALAFSGVQVLLSTRRPEDVDDEHQPDDGTRDGA